jgi:hypothetical protein
MSQLEPDSPAQRFADTVQALVVAWRIQLAYPIRHPAVIRRLEDACVRVTELLTSTGPLSIGITRQGLRFHGIRLSTRHAIALSGVLYRRQAAVLRIEPGISVEELESFFGLLDPDPDSEPAVFASRVSAMCPHLSVWLIDYSILRLTDTIASATSTAEREAIWDRLVSALVQRTELSEEAESAWDNILRMLAEDKTVGDSERSAGPRSPWTDRAEMAANRLGIELASRLAVMTNAARSILARHLADFARGLPDALRDVVLASAMGILATDERGAEALHALASPFAPGAILSALRTLEATGVGLSGRALRVLRSLAALPLPVDGPVASEQEGDPGELVVLYRREDIDRYNPQDHQALFDRLALELPPLKQIETHPSPDLEDRLTSLTEEALAEQLADTLLEMLGRDTDRPDVPALLARLESLLRLFLTSGHLGQAASTVDILRNRSADPSVSPGARAVMRSILGRMAEPAILASLVAGLTRPLAPAILLAKRLIEPLGDVAIRGLVLLLTEERSLSRRRRVFDLLVSLGPPVVPHVTRWLSDSRWFVTRNMIALLRAVGDTTLLPAIRRHAVHPDLRVRLEALKSLVTLDAYESRDILRRAMNDPNPRVAEVVVALAGKYGTPDLLDPLVILLSGWDVLRRNRAVRLRALRALGEFADPRALPHLAQFFRNWRVPLVSVEERRAAFESLQGYPEAARRRFVENGLRSKDPAIREMCRRLADIA